MKARILIIALLIALLIVPSAFAEVTELSGLYGTDIAAAALQLGNMTDEGAGEFKSNYTGGGVSLRGDDTVHVIDVSEAAKDVSLCGVTIGMSHRQALEQLTAYTLLWDLDEEAAFIIVEDTEDRLMSQMLVLFLEEDTVTGMWYRSS